MAIASSVFVTAALATYLLAPLVSGLATRWRVVDVPDVPRKQHGKPVPLLGGFAIGLSFLLVVGVLAASGVLPDAKINSRMLAGVILGSVALMAGGYLDDRYRLRPILQFIAPLVAAFAVVASGMRISVVTNPLGGVIHLPELITPALTIAWVLGMTYTTKLLDGVDGLVASITTVGALIMFALSLTWDAPSISTSLLAMAVAGSALGFLPWNLAPARLFLGEGGSTLAGYLLGVLAIISGSKIATALLVIGVPALDAGWVIIERLRAGKRITAGDRRHVHYQLLAHGCTPRQVVWIMTLLAAAFGGVALVASSWAKLTALALLGTLVAWGLSWLRRPAAPPRAMGRWLLTLTAIVLGGAVLMLPAQRPALAPAPKLGRLVVGETLVVVEIASTPESRRQGLSGRPNLPDGSGMLFTFGNPLQPTFWMKDMRFPLDLLWIDGGSVVEVTRDAPVPVAGQPVATFRPATPVTAVLEVPAGFSRTYQVASGTAVRLLIP